MADDLNEEVTTPEEEEETTDLGESFVTLAESATSFSASLLQEVVDLITAMGIVLTEGDDYLLSFSAGYVEQEIKNACNVPEVPEGLYKVAVGLIVARFLSAKKAKKQVAADTLDFTPMLKELSEGDTKQVWATDSGSSAEQRLDLFISALESGRDQFITYRRLKW